jgi:hypothetical protein
VTEKEETLLQVKRKGAVSYRMIPKTIADHAFATRIKTTTTGVFTRIAGFPEDQGTLGSTGTCSVMEKATRIVKLEP